jgi:uncharacterized protein YndB with AHSA1/START domain
MTTTTRSRFAIRLERRLSAPPGRVFAALTDPAQIVHWFCPTPEHRAAVHAWDLRVGGRYRISLTHSGGKVHTAVGEFREITDGRRLKKTWAWEGEPPMDSLVTFELTPTESGTLLVLTHEGLRDEEDCRKHEQGWNGCLDQLVPLFH